jgi:hypothetical protein
MGILIFEAEKEAGLNDQITKARTISYLSPLTKYEFSPEIMETCVKAAAEKYDINIDGLYPTQSILVSTVWNLNDDVFDKHETWMARSTPVHKPTNNNHVESEIVGHMTGSWAIDAEGNLIDDDIPADQLPDIFHILNAAVIYTAFSEPEMMARAKKLVEEIELGKKFVSMEAYFRGFDYAIVDPKGVMQIVQRNSTTAFLTKHLRAYGGEGKYEGYKIGRLLRNITFTGKGYVDKPANPASIIFDKNTTFNFISKAFIKELKSTSGVCINQTLNNTEQKTMDLEAKVTELTTANTALTQEISTVKAERDTLKAQIDELNTAKSSLETKITELTTANDGLKTEVDTFKKNEIKARRSATLVAGGFTAEEAEKKVNLFAELNDEQFKAISDELVEAKKNSKKPEEKPEEKPEKNKSELENVKPEEVIVPPQIDETTAKTRESLSKLFEDVIASTKGKRTSKKKTETQNA